MQIPPRNKQKFILNKISSSAIFLQPSPIKIDIKPKSGQYLLSPVGALSWGDISDCCTTHPRRCTLWMRSRVQWAAWPSGQWRTAVFSGLRPGSFRSCKRPVQKFMNMSEQDSVLTVREQRDWLGMWGFLMATIIVIWHQSRRGKIRIHSDTRLI